MKNILVEDLHISGTRRKMVKGEKKILGVASSPIPCCEWDYKQARNQISSMNWGKLLKKRKGVLQERIPKGEESAFQLGDALDLLGSDS